MNAKSRRERLQTNKKMMRMIRRRPKLIRGIILVL
jgi:hypothetical protein